MSGEFPNTFADENPDLKKQIGCITRIFQMFDRHRVLNGKHLNDHSHKKLPSGHAIPDRGRHESEQNQFFSQILQEKILTNNLNENQTFSVESSRASCSSSSSSSFSSLEFNKSFQASFDRTFIAERSLKNSPNKNSENDSKSKFCQQSLDFNNVVNDHTMQRDTEGFTIKTSPNDKVKNHAMQHKDSPRPVLPAKTRMPTDLNEAIRVLVELKKAPWNFPEHEVKDASSFYQESERTPRFSCDGREFSRLSMDSQDRSKPAAKVRELPRLSLDSRKESAQRSSNLVSKTSVTLEDLDRTNTTPRVNRASNLLQDLSSPRRQPGIVAKLMGLDEMPDLNSAAQEAATRISSVSFHERRDCTPATRSNGLQDAKCDWFPPSIQIQDSIMAKPKNSHSLLKHNSTIMAETAPWTHQDRGQTQDKTKTRYQGAQMKPQTDSIYKEIEEKLKRLQFKQQNKDLKALKQIVDDMLAKRLAQTTKDYPKQTPMGSNQNSRSPKVSKQPAKECGTPKSFVSPIVIVKPAKTVSILEASTDSVIPMEGLSTKSKLHTSSSGRKKSSANIAVDRDYSPRIRLGETNMQEILSTDKQFNRRSMENCSSPRSHSNSTQCLSKLLQSLGENSGISAKTSITLSPRLQQSKTEAEKSCPPASDLNRAQSQSTNRKPVESVSPRSKLGLKQSQARKNKDQVDEISPCSDKNRSLALQSTVLQQLIQSPSSRAAQNAALVLNQKNPLSNMNQPTSDKVLESIAFEHSSPVSVLDASCYQDEFLHSPAKRTSNTVKDDTRPCHLDLWCYPSGLPDGQLSKLSDDTNTNNVQAVEKLVQLKLLSSTDEETQKCNIHSPDHKYVSEILRATGFLNKDRSFGPMCSTPLQLHSSGHAINPDLFGILEKRKHSWVRKLEPNQEGTQHRKLVFDVVNEFLTHKIELIASGNRHDLRFETRRKLSGQHLLEEVWSEIKGLQAENMSSMEDDVSFRSGEDLLHQSEGWNDFGMEQSKVALQIERLILTDMIDEVVSGVTEAGFAGQVK